MPSQKRSFDDLDKQVEEEYEEEDSLSTHQKLLLQDEKDEQDPDAASVESPSSSDDKDTEFVLVKLSEIRKEVQCPICLGIIRKTRTVMECLHRFCRECIDKSMRLGNNECPACRTHCASRRSLRDDPNYDALIAVLYPDIDKYEEEELAFHEEEKVRNEQIQASIAQTSQRQTEALGKRRTRAKATVAAFMRRGNNRNSSRLRGRNRQSGNAGSDEDEEDLNVNEEANDSSSADEPSPKVRRKRQKRWATPRFSPAMGTGTNSDGGCNGTGDIEVCRESTSASPARAGNPEVLVWGKGGTRSHTRHGSLSGSNGRNGRSNRVSKLIDYLRNLDESDDGFDVHVTLLPMDNKIPRLQRPFLCCRPTLSVKHLCQFIALQIHVQEEELEIFVEEPKHSTGDQCGLSLNPYLTSMNEQIPKLEFDDAIKGEPHILDAQETLADLHAAYNSSHGNLVLVYRSKLHELGTAKATTDVGFDFTV